MNLPDDISVKDIDVLIIGGGTAGPMAAVAAKEKNPEASVIRNVEACGSIRNENAFYFSRRLQQVP